MLLQNIKSLSSLFCCLSVILTGCCFTPLYERLPLPIAETYPRQEYVQNGTNIRQFGWQEFFNDSNLKQLIALALDNNRDLRAARQRSEEAKALQNAPCSEEYLASLEEQHATYIRLVGQVAGTYLIESELNELICLTLKTIETRQEGCRIMELRFEEGAASKFDFFQAGILLQQAEADLVALQRRRALNWNTMTLLVGIPICPGDQLLCQIEPYFIKEISPGLPSELLANRPDVRAAEHKLLAANANIGGPRASIFNLSRIRQNLAVTEYERTIQVAFREVADALAERDLLTEQVLMQKEVLDAQTERARLAWIRFLDSTSSFLEVLDAEREKFSAEQALVQTRRSLLAGRINLYIALGGGYCR